MKTFKVYVIDHEIVGYLNEYIIEAETKEQAEFMAMQQITGKCNYDTILHDCYRSFEYYMNEELVKQIKEDKFELYYLDKENPTEEIPSKEEQQMADKLNRIAMLENEIKKLKSEIE